MTIAKNEGRQDIVHAEVEFAFDDFDASGVLEEAVDLPMDAVVVGGDLIVDTPFNSATSDTLTVGDADDDDRYAAAVDGTAAGRTALVPTGHRYTGTIRSIGVKWTGVGAVPTQGAGRLMVSYIRTGRTHHTIG